MCHFKRKENIRIKEDLLNQNYEIKECTFLLKKANIVVDCNTFSSYSCDNIVFYRSI